jgi:nicotinate-nucleotide pyrophosphorylase (carboxylating)
MAQHVAILYKHYIELILAGRKTVESRLTKGALVPHRAVEPGDRIWFKVSSGPFMATAIAGDVRFHDGLTPAKVAKLKREHNAAVCGDDAYWQRKGDARFATFIELRDVEAIDAGPLFEPSRGPAWFVIDKQPAGTVTLTGGAIRNRYLRAPGCFPRGQAIQLIMPGDERIDTDVRDDGLIRWRGWGVWYQRWAAKPGDAVRFDSMGQGRYRVSMTAAAPLSRFVSAKRLAQLIRQAKTEDMGPPDRDITSDSLVPPEVAATAVMRSRANGVLCGAALLQQVAAAYDPAIDVDIHMTDGASLHKASDIATFRGPLRSILAMERVALNFVTHLSGIASLTAKYVSASQAAIYDTRKTIAGLRGLAKYAVVCGGGHSHRIGLYDAVLVKDNHIAHIPPAQLAAELNKAIATARRADPPPSFIEVEVDTLDQLARVLACDVDVVLLDNMPPEVLAQAVAMRDAMAKRVQLEASGGVSLRTVKAIAATGVDRIAIGALTHSAPALDVGLDIDQ